MLCRLSLPSATKQLLIVAAGSAVSLVIPVMIRKMKFLKDLTWAYAGIGIVLLAAVLVLASTSYGAKLSLTGNPAFRGDQDNLRIFYGITSVYQGGFSQSSTGYDRCSDPCRDPGSFQGSG